MIIDLANHVEIFNKLSEEYSYYYPFDRSKGKNDRFSFWIKKETNGVIKSNHGLFSLGTISFENNEDYFLFLLRYS